MSIILPIVRQTLVDILRLSVIQSTIGLYKNLVRALWVSTVLCMPSH